MFNGGIMLVSGGLSHHESLLLMEESLWLHESFFTELLFMEESC
jgi:hypothetical protein